jgi:hypothetical protein
LVNAPAPHPRSSYYPPRPETISRDPGYRLSAPGDEWDSPTHTDLNDRPSRVANRRAAASRARGLPGWLALLVLLVIAGIGGIIDMISGSTVRGGFNISLVVASLVAILIVRHKDMFPIVVAPPLVYIVASVGMLYIRSGGLHNRKILIDSAANWLVYGFPAIAGATAAVLIVGGIRLVLGR